VRSVPDPVHKEADRRMLRDICPGASLRFVAARLTHCGQPDVSALPKHTEGIEQPDDHRDHDDDIHNVLNLSVHRDVFIDDPEKHADDEKSYYDCEKRHDLPLFWDDVILAGNPKEPNGV